VNRPPLILQLSVVEVRSLRWNGAAEALHAVPAVLIRIRVR
jgi:hypothetical protein